MGLSRLYLPADSTGAANTTPSISTERARMIFGKYMM
jgi:hypothetical protein